MCVLFFLEIVLVSNFPRLVVVYDRFLGLDCDTYYFSSDQYVFPMSFIKSMRFNGSFVFNYICQ